MPRFTFSQNSYLKRVTREEVGTLERKLKGTLSLKRRKLLRRLVDLKITLILQKGRYLLILFCKRVLIARDKLPRYDRVINNSFFSTVNATGICKTFLFENEKSLPLYLFDYVFLLEYFICTRS